MPVKEIGNPMGVVHQLEVMNITLSRPLRGILKLDTNSESELT